MLRLMRAAFLLGWAMFTCLAADAQNLTLRLRGSDSMDPLLRLWIEEFQRKRPEVQVDIESQGSGTAPAALLGGTADLGHMSRPMNSQEQEGFVARHGSPAVGVTVAYDALAVFVHQANPLRRLSTEQLDAIFSRTRLSGWEEPITRWGDLYLRAPLKRMDIRPWSRDERSGTRAFFQEQVMKKEGQLRDSVQIADQLGILDAIAKDPAAIGYGPLTYATPQVRMVPLAGPRSGRACLPSPATIQSGDYPLARSLRIYVKKVPGQPLAEVPRAFLTFILSEEGQQLAERYGSVPLSPEARASERARIQ